MPGFKLYELPQAYNAILAAALGGADEAVDPTTGEVIDAGAFDSALAALTDAIDEKVDNCAAVVRTLEAEAEALRVEERRMAARRQGREKAIEHLKQYVRENMTALGIPKVKGSRFTVWVQKGASRVDITDEKAIPREFVVVKEEVSRSLIAKVLKEGNEVPGAALVEGTPSLQIR